MELRDNRKELIEKEIGQSKRIKRELCVWEGQTLKPGIIEGVVFDMFLYRLLINKKQCLKISFCYHKNEN